MNYYTNKHCGECGESFKEDDDVAVCPECGTSVHRSCWAGKCPNADKHADGYEWKEESSEAPAEEKKICPNCETKVDKSMMYCPQCGVPLGKQAENRAKYDELFTRDDSSVISFSSFEDFADKMERNPIRNSETGEELTCYGVKQKELIRFLGRYQFSTSRFLTSFLQMANMGRKVSLNICAGFFMPYYQFYRRAIGPGIVVLLLNYILNLPFVLYLTDYLYEYMNDVAVEAVLAAETSLLFNVFSVISSIFQIAVLLFWDYFYMKWSVNKILSIREEYADAPEEEYFAALEKAGNPKWSGVYLALLIMCVLLCIVGYMFKINII